MSTEPKRPRLGRPRASAAEASEDTREDILIAASRLFSERGYESTQLKHIAEATGLRTPSLYYYFSGREEIRQALSAYTVEESAAFATDIVKQPGPAAVKLCRLLASHFDRLTSGPYDLWFLITLSGKTGQGSEGEKVGARYSAWQRSVKTLVNQAVEQGDFRPIDPDFALYMIIGCVHGALELRHRGKDAAPGDMVDFIIRALGPDSARADDILAQAKDDEPSIP